METPVSTTIGGAVAESSEPLAPVAGTDFLAELEEYLATSPPTPEITAKTMVPLSDERRIGEGPAVLFRRFQVEGAATYAVFEFVNPTAKPLFYTGWYSDGLPEWTTQWQSGSSSTSQFQSTQAP